MILVLPYPPTANTIWRKVGKKTLLSAKARDYRAHVGTSLVIQGVKAAGPLAGRLAVRIEVHAPDKRARDLDNIPKAVFDALTHAGVWQDDSQIDDMRVTRCHAAKGGALRVYVEEME